jgi:hypothetical protein
VAAGSCVRAAGTPSRPGRRPARRTTSAAGGSPAGYAYGAGGPLLGMVPPGGSWARDGRAPAAWAGGDLRRTPPAWVVFVCGSSRQPGLAEVWMRRTAASSFYDV